MYIEVDKPYCDLYFTGNFKYHIEVTLKEMIDNLPKAGFLLCKRSAVVNLCYIKSFNLKKNPPTIVMNDDKIFKLSKKNKLEVEEMLKSTPRISPPCTPCYTCSDDECENQIVFCRRKELQQQKKPENPHLTCHSREGGNLQRTFPNAQEKNTCKIAMATCIFV